MLAHLLVIHFSLGIDLDLTNVFWVLPNDDAERLRGWPAFRYRGILPAIAATHAAYRERDHAGSAICFLVRDPRDTLVSYWLHRSHQLGTFEGSAGDFIRHPRHGITGLVTYLDGWAKALTRESGLILSYEEMQLNTADALRRVAAHFALPATAGEIAGAVEAGRFDRMRERELRGGLAGHDYARTDEEALRVRRGVVHGYTDYLSEDDEALIRRHIMDAPPRVRRLVERTGYVDGAGATEEASS